MPLRERLAAREAPGQKKQQAAAAPEWSYGLGVLGAWFNAQPCIFCNASPFEIYEGVKAAFRPRTAPFDRALIRLPPSRFHYGRLHRFQHFLGGLIADTLRLMQVLWPAAPHIRVIESLTRGLRSERGSHSFDPLARKQATKTSNSSKHTIWPAIYERVFDQDPVFDVLLHNVTAFFDLHPVAAEVGRHGLDRTAPSRCIRYAREIFNITRGRRGPLDSNLCDELCGRLTYVDHFWLKVAKLLPAAQVPHADVAHLPPDARPSYCPQPTARSIVNHVTTAHLIEDLSTIPPHHLKELSEKGGEGFHNPAARLFMFASLQNVSIKWLTPRLHLKLLLLYSVARLMSEVWEDEWVEADVPKHLRSKGRIRLRVKVI